LFDWENIFICVFAAREELYMKKGWNPFGKVDMEIGSFLKKSVFNKDYERIQNENKESNSERKR
jgi:hypothetical protein